MAFIRVFLVIFIIYFGLKFVLKHFFPFLISDFSQKKTKSDWQGDGKVEKEGTVTIDKKPEKNSQSKSQKFGEYVDYEELD